MEKVKDEEATVLMKVGDKISSLFLYGISFLKKENEEVDGKRKKK